MSFTMTNLRPFTMVKNFTEENAVHDGYSLCAQMGNNFVLIVGFL